MQTINLQYAPTAVNPVVHVSQFDVGRQFKFKLYDGSIAYSMPSGTTAQIDGIKPDGKGFSYTDCISVSGNEATVTTKKQMTIVSGAVKCEIRFIKGDENIGTLNFLMIVEDSPINENTDISETVLPVIFRLATEQMENAEAWAKGTKNGVAVGSSEPQYHNNAKYWNDQTQVMADDAEAWARGTRGGTAVGSGDETFHNNSKFYAEESESHADDSEAWAIGERDGVPVSSGDDTYENNSKYWADHAASIIQTTAASVIATCQDWAQVAKNWAVGPSGSGTGTDINNSKYWSEQSYDYFNQIISEAQSISAIVALIHMLFSSVYMDAENGDRLLTESGDNIVIDY